MFVRTEDFKTFRRKYPIVTALIAIHLVLFILYILPFQNLGLWIYNHGVGFNQLIAEGQWWRVITPIFLHANFPHVLFNSFSLFLFAPALEEILGKPRFLLGYLGAGIIANIATYYFEPMNYIYLGSSGSIFGLFGIYIYLVFFRKEFIDSTNAKVITTILVISFIMTFIQPNIDILGHVFGFIAGFLLSTLLFLNHSRSI